MAWESRVEFKGLTAMMLDLQGRAKRTMPLIGVMTRGLMDAHHALYVQNLSGSVPSTDSRPLPVGIRSGFLRSQARKRQLNQYSYRVWNDAYYAAFIEAGTVKMSARAPLRDATDQIEHRVPGKMAEVMAKAWRV